MKGILLGCVILGALRVGGWAQAPTASWVEWDDLAAHTYVWEGGAFFTPYFSEVHHTHKTVYLRISPREYPNGLLEICWPKHSLLTIQGSQTLVKTNRGCQRFDMDSLSLRVGTAVVVALHSEILRPGVWSARVIRTQLLQVMGEGDVALLEPRETNYFRLFFSYFLLAVGLYMSLMWRFYPKIFNEYFQLLKALSFRSREEVIANMRMFTIPNLLTFSFISVISGGLFTMLLYFSGTEFLPFSLEGFGSYSSVFLQMIKWSSAFFVAILMKYYLVRNFALMFKVPAFANSHFYNFLRLHFAFFGIALVVAFLAYYSFDVVRPGFYLGLLKSLFWCISAAVVILFLKLLQAGSFRVFHLFSYICATEILPLFVLVKLTWA
jgi:hypothetical protein